MAGTGMGMGIGMGMGTRIAQERNIRGSCPREHRVVGLGTHDPRGLAQLLPHVCASAGSAWRAVGCSHVCVVRSHVCVVCTITPSRHPAAMCMGPAVCRRAWRQSWSTKMCRAATRVCRCTHTWGHTHTQTHMPEPGLQGLSGLGAGAGHGPGGTPGQCGGG